MADAGRYMFRAAKDAHAQITRLFDFVAPTAIALWNLRWQVQGFLTASPAATQEDLSARFALGSGMRGGEIKRACVNTTWEHQLGQFASFVLITAVAIFEDYTADLAEAAGGNHSHQQRISKALQFPSSGQSNYGWALSELNRSSSTALQGVFINSCRSRRKYSGSTIDNLLVCYRYFKEARNCIAHHGGTASAIAVQAYNAFSAAATASALGISEVPKHHPFVAGQSIKLELRGVIGLCDVILRIIATYDAELSETTLAENEITTRMTPARKGTMLPSNPRTRAHRVVKRVEQAGFPTPNMTNDFENFLRRMKLIPVF